MEAVTPNYWRDRIARWKKVKTEIVIACGEKYYLEHLAKFEENLKASSRQR